MTAQQGAAGTGNGLYPLLEELAALRQDVRLLPLRRPRTRASGVLASRQPGRGMDHADTRPYIPGDEARHVDWRVTARSGQLHSKRFHAERDHLCMLLADPQPAQFFATRARYKSVQCARAGAAAAWWAHMLGDRVAMLDTASGQVCPAGTGIDAVMRVLQGLVQAYAQPPRTPGCELAPLLRQAAGLSRGGTLVVLAEPARALSVPRALWQACARQAAIHLVLVNDVLELDPPRRRLQVAATNGRQWLDLGQPAQRAQWLAQAATPRQALLDWQVPGLQVHGLLTGDDASGWLPLAGSAAR